MDRARCSPTFVRLLDALNFFREPFACILRELFAAVFGDLTELGLLFRRQQILDRHRQSDMQMLQFALDVEDLVELCDERSLIHPFLFRQRRKRGGFALPASPAVPPNATLSSPNARKKPPAAAESKRSGHPRATPVPAG